MGIKGLFIDYVTSGMKFDDEILNFVTMQTGVS